MLYSVNILRTAHPGAVLTQLWTPRQQLELIIHSAQTLGEEEEEADATQQESTGCPCHSWGSDPLPLQEQGQLQQGLSSAGQEHGWELQQSIHHSFCPGLGAFPLPSASCSQQGMSKHAQHFQFEFGHNELAWLEVPSLTPAAHEKSSMMSPVDLMVHS